MAKTRIPTPLWLDQVEAQDYPAAQSYLSLLYPVEKVTKLVEKLKAAKLKSFAAKDIFRASRLSLLGVSNSHVEKDKRKIMSGKSLSPLLLVRDTKLGSVVVADGYHRLCAVYGFDEDAVIPCKIV